MLTEFGATKDAGVNLPMVERADANMIGWQYWHYCGCDDPTTTGPGDTQALVFDPAKPPAGENLDPVKLDVLVRPFPRVVAGRPIAWTFEDGVFELTWKARKGRTEIAVPRRAFPKGYRVEASPRIRVKSKRNARTLVLRARRGVRQVEVHAR